MYVHSGPRRRGAKRRCPVFVGVCYAPCIGTPYSGTHALFAIASSTALESKARRDTASNGSSLVVRERVEFDFCEQNLALVQH
jgi:hypothetical protein